MYTVTNFGKGGEFIAADLYIETKYTNWIRNQEQQPFCTIITDKIPRR